MPSTVSPGRFAIFGGTAIDQCAGDFEIRIGPGGSRITTELCPGGSAGRRLRTRRPGPGAGTGPPADPGLSGGPGGTGPRIDT
ncbi:hypothetical protein GCM10015535_02220 [Streptomyces gelaticus]|uniref:Uncharacterized protein n=1 Tax=Streptomyces gelaticus TaxID=285446 RepID=A0ABQ2VQ95_9ACTN|nr:hypothetical protein [Streptomyces gelaticus]GGV74054.1 hypothetical protein GCM10015535_02220 [Streptomyces gelaticus]